MNLATKLPTERHRPVATCQHCLLAKFCWPESHHSLALQSINLLVKQRLLLRQKRSLCHAGDHFTALYTVQSGAIKSYEVGCDGELRINQFYLPGEMLGFDAIAPQVFPYHLEATKDTVLCEISYEDLLAAIAPDPILQRRFLTLMSRHITLNAYLHHVRAEQRFIGFLLALAGRLRLTTAPYEFDLPMSRQEVADHLGLAHETVIRIFSRLEQRGLLHSHKRHIILHNMVGLHAAMQGAVQ